MKSVLVLSLAQLANQQSNLQAAQELSHHFKQLDTVYQHVQLDELRTRFQQRKEKPPPSPQQQPQATTQKTKPAASSSEDNTPKP